MSKEMKHILTKDEIQTEITKIEEFFSQIPNDLKADAAEHFIVEIVNWASRDFYQALGIFEESKMRYHALWMDNNEEEEDVDGQS